MKAFIGAVVILFLILGLTAYALSYEVAFAQKAEDLLAALPESPNGGVPGSQAMQDLQALWRESRSRLLVLSGKRVVSEIDDGMEQLLAGASGDFGKYKAGKAKLLRLYEEFLHPISGVFSFIGTPLCHPPKEGGGG